MINLLFDGVDLPCISFEDAKSLSTSIFPLEVDLVMPRINECKSLGVGDFNFMFYKRIWGIIKEDVYVMFDQFF